MNVATCRMQEEKKEQEDMDTDAAGSLKQEEGKPEPAKASTSDPTAGTTGAGTQKKKCVITYVRDPLPAAVTSGRMSFGAASKPAEKPAQDVVVTDADMAAAFQRGGQGKEKEKEKAAPAVKQEQPQAAARAPQQPAQAGNGGGDFMSMGYKPLREAKKRKVT